MLSVWTKHVANRRKTNAELEPSAQHKTGQHLPQMGVHSITGVWVPVRGAEDPLLSSSLVVIAFARS